MRLTVTIQAQSRMSQNDPIVSVGQRIRRAALGLALTLGAFGAFAIPVVLSNASTSVSVHGGEAGNALIPFGGYFDYMDLVAGTTTTWSVDPFLRFADTSVVALSAGGVGGFGSPLAGVGTAVSSASTGAVSTTAVTELIGTIARTTFTFTAAPGATLSGTTFGFYAENDILGFSDDTATFTGSIAGADLALFQYDTGAGGVTVRLSAAGGPGATLVSFGSGIYTAFGDALELGDLSVLSADGSNFKYGPGDLGLALAFSLSGITASLVVDYTTQPLPPGNVPEPESLALTALGLFALLAQRRFARRAA